eukprot:3914230-Pyramimonas_sp.AAC.1
MGALKKFHTQPLRHLASPPIDQVDLRDLDGLRHQPAIDMPDMVAMALWAQGQPLLLVGVYMAAQVGP